jgi:hypothetical protein
VLLWCLNFQVIPAIFALESPVSLDFVELHAAITQKAIVSFNPSMFDPNPSTHEAKSEASVLQEPLSASQFESLEAKIREAVEKHAEQSSSQPADSTNSQLQHGGTRFLV